MKDEEVILRTNNIGVAINSATNLLPKDIPMTMFKNIQPSLEVNPFIVSPSSIAKSNTATNTTSVTIYTTPTDQDFYLTSAAVSLCKDVNSTSTASYINVTVGGSLVTVVSVAGITLTAQDGNQSLSFFYPVKIDRNTSINLTNGTAGANVISKGIITGFLIDPKVYNTVGNLMDGK